MRAFADHNPIAVAVYFLSVAGVAMFSMDPALLFFSLLGALSLHFLLSGLRNARIHLYILLLFLGTTLINPLVSHRGATVLFVMNHNPVTLEALCYGAAAGAMIAGTLYWFRSFSTIMTSDKLLYLFGALSPKLSLILSMTLRYVPLFGKQVQKTRQAQQALGLYKDDNIVDRFRGGLRIFSVMVTWALENGIITADSMTARGYGLGKRSQFHLFRWQKDDVVLLAASLILLCTTLLCTHDRNFSYYPYITAAPLNAHILTGYVSYALLTVLPLIIHAKEVLRWRCLQSNM